MGTSKSGFTLIELMIVVAIIAVIAAIAIPNLLRARIQSNESAAVGNLRSVVGAQMAFNAKNSEFAVAFADLTGDSPPFLNGNWAQPKSGYLFVLGGDPMNFTCNANAVEYGVTGVRGFFTDSSGVIRYEVGANATIDSRPIHEEAL